MCSRFQLDFTAAQTLLDGFAVLPLHFPAQKLRAWNDRFAPLLARHIERQGALKNRGAGRYYVTLPFTMPWADPEIFEDPDVLGVAERLVGKDLVMCQLATDTPLLGESHAMRRVRTLIERAAPTDAADRYPVPTRRHRPHNVRSATGSYSSSYAH